MSHEIRRVLVIKLSALGDFVLALAAMKRIREAHPKAHITLLTTPLFEALARACPYFDEVDAGGKPEGPGEWMALRQRLKAGRFDRVYDLQTSAASARLFLLLWPFPPAWSGVAFGCALPHRTPGKDLMHTLERQADQLKSAGIWPDAPTTPFSAPPPDLSWIGGAGRDRRRRSDRPFIMLIPGGSAHRLDKRWPAEGYGRLARRLHARGYDIVVIGGPQESALAREIQRSLPQARDLTGRTDFATVALLGAETALVVGNDTGPLHLASAAGAPTVALFSRASDPGLSAPRGHVIVIQTDDLAGLDPMTVERAANSLLPPAGSA
ncbi:glycosyltransferase family 9 protein [Phenylobacterium sp.]|uniref:glycosyltransferase family 9 protein n=1 Tax=Phenylobacterium sp. TaxID=1871053 RepID=UPI0025DAA416|nr:glycosyltransferase family 9 protein [Phenylobacterium sp.]MCA6227379.1 glycosyltransferase family 9 protein [Phenylobacterium sp.]